MQLGRLATPVVHADLNQQVLRRLLGILDEHIEVPIVIEHTGVEQLVLEFVATAPSAGVNKIGIRKGRLRILVEILHV